MGNREKACEILHSYIYDKIHRQLGSNDLTEKFPAIDFKRALETKDKINIEHFERILRRFNKIKYLVGISEDNLSDDSIVWILNYILPTCQTLKVVGESEESMHYAFPNFLEANGNNVSILLSQKAYRTGILTCLLEKAVKLGIKPLVYLFLTEGKTVDLSEILHQEMHQLHIVGLTPGQIIGAVQKPVSAAFLTHLSIIGRILILNNVMVAINTAVREGKLSCLQSLCFTGADVPDGFEVLFRGETTLLNVTHLDFSACIFYQNLQAPYLASKNGLLPKLTSLVISDGKFSLRSGGINYFDSWVNLTTLSVKDATEWDFVQLSKAVNQSRLIHLVKLCLSVKQNEKSDLREIEPEKIPLLKHLCIQRCIESKEALERLSCLLSDWSLQTLDISHSCGIGGNLSVLTSQHFISLENLILHDCELTEQDLISLDVANGEGRLSKLEHLDLSENRLLIENFGLISSRWSSLKRLRIDYATPNQISVSKRWFNILQPLLDKGCIPSIEELRITTTNSFPERTGRWEHLKRLNIVVLEDQKIMYMFDCLVTSVQMGDLPSLRTVCLLTDNKIGRRLSNFKSYFSTLKRKSVDVCVVDQDLETIMVNAGLA